jgi:hypothetical protein
MFITVHFYDDPNDPTRDDLCHNLFEKHDGQFVDAWTYYGGGLTGQREVSYHVSVRTRILDDLTKAGFEWDTEMLIPRCDGGGTPMSDMSRTALWTLLFHTDVDEHAIAKVLYTKAFAESLGQSLSSGEIADAIDEWVEGKRSLRAAAKAGEDWAKFLLNDFLDGEEERGDADKECVQGWGYQQTEKDKAATAALHAIPAVASAWKAVVDGVGGEEIWDAYQQAVADAVAAGAERPRIMTFSCC